MRRLELTPSTTRRQAIWALVRLLIANIVGKFAQLLQSIGRQRMSEVEQQGRRAVLVYYWVTRYLPPRPPPQLHSKSRCLGDGLGARRRTTAQPSVLRLGGREAPLQIRVPRFEVRHALGQLPHVLLELLAFVAAAPAHALGRFPIPRAAQPQLFVLVVGAPSGRRRPRAQRLTYNFVGLLGRRRMHDAGRRERHGLGHHTTTNHSIGLRCWLIVSRNNTVALVALRRGADARQIP